MWHDNDRTFQLDFIRLHRSFCGDLKRAFLKDILSFIVVLVYDISWRTSPCGRWHYSNDSYSYQKALRQCTRLGFALSWWSLGANSLEDLPVATEWSRPAIGRGNRLMTAKSRSRTEQALKGACRRDGSRCRRRIAKFSTIEKWRVQNSTWCKVTLSICLATLLQFPGTKVSVSCQGYIGWSISLVTVWSTLNKIGAAMAGSRCKNVSSDTRHRLIVSSSSHSSISLQWPHRRSTL